MICCKLKVERVASPTQELMHFAHTLLLDSTVARIVLIANTIGPELHGKGSMTNS